jgi:hypothetical protein
MKLRKFRSEKRRTGNRLLVRIYLKVIPYKRMKPSYKSLLTLTENDLIHPQFASRLKLARHAQATSARWCYPILLCPTPILAAFSSPDGRAMSSERVMLVLLTAAVERWISCADRNCKMASDPPKVLISYSSFYWYPVSSVVSVTPPPPQKPYCTRS